MHRTIIVAALSLAAGRPVAAQMPMSPVFNAAIVNGPGMMVWQQGINAAARPICGRYPENDDERANLLALQRAGCKAGLTLPRASLPVADQGAALTYTASPARTRANIAAFADKSRAVDPQGAAGLVALFASTDVMGQLDSEMRKLGLTRTNVADAYAMWWTVAWLATQGRNEDLPREQWQAIKRQAVGALRATPQLATATDAQKQELAEAYLVQAMLIDGSVDMAREQPALMAPLKAAVAQGAKASGLDLSAMTLTPHGFRMGEGR